MRKNTSNSFLILLALSFTMASTLDCKNLADEIVVQRNMLKTEDAKQAFDASDFLDQHRIDDSIKAINKAITINPHRSAYFEFRAALHVEKKEYKKAIADLDIAMKLAPNDNSIYVTRGATFALMDKLDDALLNINEAIKINPNYERSYTIRKGIRFLQRDYKGARADAEKVLQLDPNSVETKVFLEKLTKLESLR